MTASAPAGLAGRPSRVPVDAADGGQPEPELVVTQATHLASLTVHQLAPARPPGSERLLAFGQRLQLDLVAGHQGGLGVIDHGPELLDQYGHRRPAAVQAGRHRVPGVPPTVQGRIVDQQAGPAQAPRRRLRQHRCAVHVDPVGNHGGNHHVVGQRREVHPEAARCNGHVLCGNLLGQQHEGRRGRRLLDGLEKAGRRLGLCRVKAIHHDHLAVGLDRRPPTLDRDPLGIGHQEGATVGLHVNEVGMLAGDGQPAVSRGCLGLRTVGRFAPGEERSGEGPGCLFPAGTGWAHEQEGVDRSDHGGPQERDRGGLSDDRRPEGVVVHRGPVIGSQSPWTRHPNRSSTAAATLAATSSTGPLPSTTSHLSGSAAAISR